MPEKSGGMAASQEVVDAEQTAITVRAILTNPIQLEIPGKPVQIAVVVGLAMKELIRQQIVEPGATMRAIESTATRPTAA